MDRGRKIVIYFQDLGVTDGSLGVLIGRHRDTIQKIGRGSRLANRTTLARLEELYRLHRSHNVNPNFQP